MGIDALLLLCGIYHRSIALSLDNLTVDVAIVGAGPAGLSAAWRKMKSSSASKLSSVAVFSAVLISSMV